jgi:ActR/RegA family two-component response regulator
MRRRPGRRSKIPASLAKIDLERVKRALFKHEGNVSKAARR